MDAYPLGTDTTSPRHDQSRHRLHPIDDGLYALQPIISRTFFGAQTPTAAPHLDLSTVPVTLLLLTKNSLW